jgi:glucosyl-dolichyl phosphate glucuronosyltransferase
LSADANALAWKTERPMPQLIEIAICTWNRADLLRGTLKSIFATTIPSGWQRRILVVDNRSTDQTPELLQEYAASHSDLQVFNETQQGHSFARNRAIENSKGDLMVWTDDDVRVPTNWLANYIAAAESNPSVSFWGSAIKPEFVSGRPTWLTENWAAVSGCFAERDLGEEPIVFTSDRLPYGANFAVRGEVQRQFLFNTSYGRSGKGLMGEDELDLLRRLLAKGHRGSWVPRNGVQHIIPADRATTNYVWRYFVGQGQRLGMNENNSAWKLLATAHWRALRYRLARRFGAPSPAWFAHLACWGLAQGRLNALQMKKKND